MKNNVFFFIFIVLLTKKHFPPPLVVSPTEQPQTPVDHERQSFQHETPPAVPKRRFLHQGCDNLPLTPRGRETQRRRVSLRTMNDRVVVSWLTTTRRQLAVTVQ